MGYSPPEDRIMERNTDIEGIKSSYTRITLINEKC